MRKDNFRKRNRTFIRKADELARIPGAKVYTVVLYHGQTHVYTSHSDKAWPPSREEIVRGLRALRWSLFLANFDAGSKLSVR